MGRTETNFEGTSELTKTRREREMTQQFAGKSALVTGGGSGIGRATALALAAEGALVTAAGRMQETLKETVRLIEAARGSARFVVAYMTDESHVKNAVDAATGDIGYLDLAVNNAGYDGEYQLTKDYSTEMLDRMIALNIRGVFLSMKYELLDMVSQGSGSIVNMSSGAGLVGVPGFSDYTATKAAEIAMTKNSALKGAPHGIRINAVCPGLADTPMIACGAELLARPSGCAMATHSADARPTPGVTPRRGAPPYHWSIAVDGQTWQRKRMPRRVAEEIAGGSPGCGAS
jgi:NAD(P)-dependent dehydrogenase (short-subunit alcohol dehydrogenase family)